MNLTWFLRMARWVRRPPSAGRVALVIAIVVLCFVVAGIEAAGLWPEGWATQGGARALRP